VYLKTDLSKKTLDSAYKKSKFTLKHKDANVMSSTKYGKFSSNIRQEQGGSIEPRNQTMRKTTSMNTFSPKVKKYSNRYVPRSNSKI
jgi:hypothetical protein